MVAFPSALPSITPRSPMQPDAAPTDQQHVPAPRSAEEAEIDTEQPALTEREQQILAFEQKWWKHAGSKEQAIRDTFALSSTRYYQVLNSLLDNPAALAHDPMLVGRLRRLRSTRARTRRR
ncbi:DUF3263 domain-containing protein [Actinoplanes sp. NPDC051859]|uniref:DUF3263 domain-containing protein n=1 Tax=Actinoplanes sp. NPDC051859 TaxID=3363909 RepID=UPI0037B04A5A